MKTKLIIGILVIWGISFIELKSENYTGSILKFPYGASCLNGANGALLSSSNESVSVNPAIISSFSKYQASITRNIFPYDRSSAFFSLNMQNQDINFSLNYYQFTLDEIEKRNLNGDLTGSFEDKTQVYFVTIGNKKNELSWGLNIKLVTKSIYEQSASGVAFDFGTLYEIRKNHFVGYSLKNFDLIGMFEGELNPKLKWEVKLWNNKETNFEYKIGNSHLIHYMGKYKNINFGISYLNEQNGNDYINGALSYRLSEELSLKCALYNERPVWGFGVKTEILKYDVIMSYSYYEEDVIGEPCHFFTWTFLP